MSRFENEKTVRGLPCPKCEGSTHVIDTRERQDGTRYRRRGCLDEENCGHRFATREVRAGDVLEEPEDMVRTPKTPEQRFLEAWGEVQAEVRAIAVDKGWEDDETHPATQIALMHSELSEGLEAARHGNPPSDKITEFSGLEEEFADVVIRIMHYAERRGLEVSRALVAKMEYNAGRPRKHGGKEF